MFITCPICAGTGFVNGQSCSYCAAGVLGFGKIHCTEADMVILALVLAKLPSGSKIVYTHKIVAVIDTAEYAALVDPAKDGLRMIISCGVVDLDHAGAVYADLMAIFASSPITKAAIEAL